MNKAELVAKVAQGCGLTKVAAERALQTVLSAIENEVAAGGEVTIVGFGAFRGSPAPPAPRETLALGPSSRSSRTVPTFAPGKGFKDKVVGWKRN
jgi:DNA-binding protein HU-beta